jgi:hypothetical protein
MWRGLIVILTALVLCAGTWTEHGFIYKPDLGAKGPEEKATFDTGLDQLDARLGKYKTLGDPNYGTLPEALASIGAEGTTLFIPAGTVNVAEDLTVPANVHLQVLKGGIFQVDDGVTLTIDGSFEAGPWQVFAGTGQVNMSNAKVGTAYMQWWADGGANKFWESGLGSAAANIAISTEEYEGLYFQTGSRTRFHMTELGDFIINTGGGGLILSNPDGTITRRVRLNDDGSGLVFEDLEEE